MKTMRLFTIRIAVFLSVVLVASTFAEDPPSRAVRLQYVTGQVSVQPGGVNDWVAASINRPIAAADRVWTDKDSRAELHLGTAAIRMNAETSLTLSNLTDNTVQVELDQGTLNLRIRRLYSGEIYEVDTPNLAFTIRKTGVYRFDVDSNGDTTNVTVFKGEGDATGDGPVVRVRSHEQARFMSGKSMAHQLVSAPGFDGFDDWCRVRDDREDKSVSAHYVSPGVPGADDLDDYGYWRTIPPYGPVWVPTAVVAGWAPYRYGHWIFVAPWGWTWVDDAPWGYAPFHYGRWIYNSGYWGWVPGPVAVRPVYAPALVAWVGGEHWGVGVSVGVGAGVGWFPLGYGEPYIPYYHCSRDYFHNVNVANTHITNITYVTNNYYNNTTNIAHIKYVNQGVPDGVTVVHRQVMENSQPVARSIVHVDAREYSGASVMAGPGVDPSRHSVLGMHAGAPSAAPPAHVISRPVVSRIAPPPRPAPFREIEKDRDGDRDRDKDRGQGGHFGNPDRNEPAGHAPGRQSEPANANNAPPFRRDNENPHTGDSAENPSGKNNANPSASMPHPTKTNEGREQQATDPDHGRRYPHPPDHDTDRPDQSAGNNRHNGNNGNNADHPASSPSRNDDARGDNNSSQRPVNAGNEHNTPHPPDHDTDRPDQSAGNNGHNGNNGNNADHPASSPSRNDDARGDNNSSQRPMNAGNEHNTPHPPDRDTDRQGQSAGNNGHNGNNGNSAGQAASNPSRNDDSARGNSPPPQPAANGGNGHTIPRPPERGFGRGMDTPDNTVSHNASQPAPSPKNDDTRRNKSAPAPPASAQIRSAPRPPERSMDRADTRGNSSQPAANVPKNNGNNGPSRPNQGATRTNVSMDRPTPHVDHSAQAPPAQHNTSSPAPHSAPAEQHHASPPSHDSKPAQHEGK